MNRWLRASNAYVTSIAATAKSPNADNRVIHFVSSHQNAYPRPRLQVLKSRPRLSAGKNVIAPTMSITSIRRMVNISVVAGDDPRVSRAFSVPGYRALASMGTEFAAARECRLFGAQSFATTAGSLDSIR